MLESFWALSEARRVSLYLEFGNAMLVAMSGACLVVFLDMLLARLRREAAARNVGLARALWLVAVAYLMEVRRFEAELTASVAVVIAGICMRAFFIWRWRDLGGFPFDFPYFRVMLSDLTLVVGFACVIRVSARKSPLNWPWLAAVTFALCFAVYSVTN